MTARAREELKAQLAAKEAALADLHEAVVRAEATAAEATELQLALEQANSQIQTLREQPGAGDRCECHCLCSNSKAAESRVITCYRFHLLITTSHGSKTMQRQLYQH